MSVSITATVAQSVTMQGAPFSAANNAVTGATGPIVETNIPYSAANVNQVEALPVASTDSGASDSGSFTLTIEGYTTGAITYSATAATLVGNINTALNSVFGSSAIVASGSTLAALVLTFSGGSYANRPIVGHVTVTNSVSNVTFAGGTNTSTTTTAGSGAITIPSIVFPKAKAQLIYLLSDQADVTVTFTNTSGNTVIALAAGIPRIYNIAGGIGNPLIYDCTTMTVLNRGSQAVATDFHARFVLSS